MAAEAAEHDGVVVGKAVMVLGIDHSEHSYYALQWTLLHFFSPVATGANSRYKLVVVNAKPTPSSVVNVAGSVVADVLPVVELDLRKNSSRVIEKATQMCDSHSVTDVEYIVMEGDARMVLCEAVEKHHAEILALGSHGYGAIKRVVLGSVSDYCTHHAHCTVMIVKKPKAKH